MVKANLVRAVEGEKGWVTYAKKRIRDNQNFVCVITGETGSGKSYSGLSYCLQIDPNFDVDKQVVFYFRDVLHLINDETFLKQEWKIILWDEIQIEMSNRKWQSKLNQSIVQLLSTFRAQNIILIMTCPNKSMLDSQVKKLLHAEFKSQGFVKKTNLCKIVPRYCQYNPDKDRVYPHKLIVNFPQAGYTPIDIWHIKKAPIEKLKIYEEKKRAFNLTLNKKIEASLNEERKGNSEELQQLIEENYKIYGKDFIAIQKNIPYFVSLSSIERIVKQIREHKAIVPIVSQGGYVSF